MATNKLSSYQTQWEGDHISGSVTYRGTTIVSWCPAWISLDTKGWKSVTTKRKMNQAAQQFGLDFGVSQRKGEWYVSRWNADKMEWFDEIPFPEDSITIWPLD